MSSMPEGLSPFSQQVFDILARYTAFPWPVLTAQCRRSSIDPLHLDQETLGKVIGPLARGVGAFTSAAKAREFEEEITLLLRPAPSAESGPDPVEVVSTDAPA